MITLGYVACAIAVGFLWEYRRANNLRFYELALEVIQVEKAEFGVDKKGWRWVLKNEIDARTPPLEDDSIFLNFHRRIRL